MATLAELTALRDALFKARAAGLREVRDSDGSSVAYKSDADMAAALGALDREIAEKNGGRTAGTLFIKTSKGY